MTKKHLVGLSWWNILYEALLDSRLPRGQIHRTRSRACAIWIFSKTTEYPRGFPLRSSKSKSKVDWRRHVWVWKRGEILFMKKTCPTCNFCDLLESIRKTPSYFIYFKSPLIRIIPIYPTQSTPHLLEALQHHRRLWADELARCQEVSQELEKVDGRFCWTFAVYMLGVEKRPIFHSGWIIIYSILMFMKLTSISWAVVSNILDFQPAYWGRFNIFQMGGWNHQLGF